MCEHFTHPHWTFILSRASVNRLVDGAQRSGRTLLLFVLFTISRCSPSIRNIPANRCQIRAFNCCSILWLRSQRVSSTRAVGLWTYLKCSFQISFFTTLHKILLVTPEFPWKPLNRKRGPDSLLKLPIYLNLRIHLFVFLLISCLPLRVGSATSPSFLSVYPTTFPLVKTGVGGSVSHLIRIGLFSGLLAFTSACKQHSSWNGSCE